MVSMMLHSNLNAKVRRFIILVVFVPKYNLRDIGNKGAYVPMATTSLHLDIDQRFDVHR